MQHFVTTPSLGKLTGLAALVLGLSLDVTAQEVFSASYAGPGSVSSAPTKDQQSMPPQPWFSSVGWGDASSDRGVVQTRSNFYSPNSSQAPAAADAKYELFDIVFGAPPGVTETTVTLNANIEGYYDGTDLSNVYYNITLTLGPGQQGGTAIHYVRTTVPHYADGLLSGWDMLSDHDITTAPITVPTNVPVKLTLLGRLIQGGSGGAFITSNYVLSLGNSSSSFLGGGLPVFGLEPGITVNSVSGDIVDNLWTPPAGPNLTTDDADVLTSDSFTLYTWAGLPGKPSALFATEVDGTPVLELIGEPIFLDTFGESTLGPIPHLAVLAGIDLGLKTVMKNEFGGLSWSDQLLLSFE